MSIFYDIGVSCVLSADILLYTRSMFDPVDPKQRFPDLELGILKYWSEEDTFKRSIGRRAGGEEFSFYDGPPFATGLPHYGHILAGTIKDVIPRYQTMRGKHVRRRFGWDCHGLPVENEIEKEHHLKSKKDIEALGVSKFNDLCRGAVQRYTKEWKNTVERMGRWVDMDHDYRTMDPDYMESIWWVFKQLHSQELIYEGHKPMHVCPRCQTPLSNFEVTQGYKDIQDYSVTAMFELDAPTPTPPPRGEGQRKNGSEKIFVLAWTTTGWTLPGNLFLAVHPETTYVTVKCEGKKFIVAKDLTEKVFAKKEYKIEKEQMGKDLVGLTYKPLFPYYAEQFQGKAFRIVAGDFVTTTDGTGIVHIATGYGDDDFQVGQREKTGVLQHVDIDGTFKKEVTDFAGKDAKPKDDHQSGDKMIAKWLQKHGKLFASESFSHSYPHCWRCDSPLLNYATSSWFVAVEKIKERMLEANAKTEWVPSHIRDGRFGKWLEGARDWAISRSRYWGTPLPIWRNSITGQIEVIGSRDELAAKAPNRFTKIIVARHAESEGNVAKFYQGKLPGTALTETGQKQAKTLAKSVESKKNESLPLKTIYCSPLQRTQQTARAIAEETGANIVIDERLREVDFGEYEGKHIDFDDLTFIKERRAHKMKKGQIESVFHFQGMETWEHTQLRMSAFLDDVLKKHRGETITVVTHADLVMNAIHHFTGIDPHKIVHQPYPDVASHRVFYWDHERGAQMDLHKETVDEITWGNSKTEIPNSKNAVELTLVRHGETDLNKQKIVQGSEINAQLNKVGRAQAKKAGESLKGKMFDVIISSHLDRASETARIIAKEIGLEYAGGFEIFRERDLGDWTGRPIEEILAQEKAPKKQVGAVMLKGTPKGGESFNQFTTRVQKAHDWLLKEYAGKKVLLVAHGGFNRASLMIAQDIPYETIATIHPKNGQIEEIQLSPQMRRIDEVLDCWFESGSMPYAQEHFPFDVQNGKPDSPRGFPADFIAEGLDQTRGWFYTLTVLSSALFQCPAFRHCIVNGIVLAEDGKKMSKRLKNYPEPTVVAERHGADAVRFALMSSPAVRGEDLRFSEKLIEETVRAVLLPLWNAYRLFVTYANAADWKPSLDFSLKNGQSKHLLDRWIVLKTQALVNNMTTELDSYDLSATCAHLTDSIDDLTNWYVRLSRRRLSGKEEEQKDLPAEASSEAQAGALDTLYRVLLANAQLLAPFCPFVSEAIYLNLVSEDHGSIHFTDWPQSVKISDDDQHILTQMDNTRSIVTLGLKLRSDAKIQVRTPLSSVTVALPTKDSEQIVKDLIKEELNVKQVLSVIDASSIASRFLQIDARKAGPRFGSKVQELIRAGKEGKFEEKDGVFSVMGEALLPGEATIVYKSKEGKNVAADRGIVVSLDTILTEAFTLEGQARELVHAIQILRKDAGLEFTDTIKLTVTGADNIMTVHQDLILQETKATLAPNKGKKETVEIDGIKVQITFERSN